MLETRNWNHIKAVPTMIIGLLGYRLINDRMVLIQDLTMNMIL